MDEKEFFNRDTMYWREVNVTAPNMIAEIELNEPVEQEGEQVSRIVGVLLPYESADVVYEMDNGGAFKKNEVIAWPYVQSKDINFYKDEQNASDDRNARILSVPHAQVKAISLRDLEGNLVLTKAKI